MRLASCLLSLLLHIALILASIYGPWASSAIQVDLEKPVYEVKLVRMPEQKKAAPVSSKNSERQQTRKKKETHKQVQPAPKPKAKPVPSVRRPAPKPEPAPIAQKNKRPQAAKAPKKKEPRPPEKQRLKKAKPAKTPESVLKDTLQELSQKAQKKTKTDEQVLDQELASLKKELAGQGQDVEQLGHSSSARGVGSVYASVVKERIKSNWRYPGMGREENLQATVKLTIGAQGQITGAELVQTSGNAQFDSSVLRAVEDTGRLPPPKPDFQTIRITFHLQDMRS